MGRFFLTPHDKPSKYVAMITVYLDESEQSVVDKYMAVAGFFGNDSQWTAFSADWKKALGPKNSLHMNELRIKSKPDRAKRLLDRLGPLPYKHGLQPICGVVRVKDYLDLIEDGDLAKKALHGYTACFSYILFALNKIVPGHESIKIVCEEQSQYGEQAYLMWRALRVKMSHPANPYFSSLEFIPKDSSVLTEPADFLAYAVTHWCEDKNSVVSTICKPILGNGTSHGYRLDRAIVRDIISKTKAVVKSRGARW